jgi:serine/threonine-protein kinase RsbW
MPLSNCTDEPGARSLTLIVPNEFEALERTRLEMRDFIAPLGLPARLVYRLELVLEEALMNRLRHAFPDGRRASTEVTLRVLPEDLLLRLEDDGIPFDPLQAAAPRAASSIEDATVGGLGLPLTRKAASACCYERLNGRNRVTIRLSRA